MDDLDSEFILMFPTFLIVEEVEIGKFTYPQTLNIRLDVQTIDAIALFTDRDSAEQFFSANKLNRKYQSVQFLPYEGPGELIAALECLLDLNPAIKEVVIDPWKVPSQSRVMAINELFEQLRPGGYSEQG